MDSTLETLREHAIALHRAGRFAEAERVYADVLQRDPADFDVLHRQGVIALETGRYARAVELIGRALALQPSVAAYFHCGAALRQLGRPAEAVASFDRAIALQPDCVEAHNNRGIALQELQRPAEALSSFEHALALRPQSAELHNNRGNILRHLRRFPDALASYERALALEPNLAAAHNNRGLTLQSLRRYAEAAASYRRALELQPQLAEAHNNLGTVLYQLGQPAAALESCGRALQLQPEMRGAHSNLGSALRDLERPEEALAHYDLAVRQEPQQADHHCLRGNALLDLQRIPEAIASYERAIELNPRHAQAHFNKGLCLLLSGELAPGLQLYEWRREVKAAPAPAVAGPVWLGDEDLAGKRLFVHADHALGDTLHFCRYAPLAAERGARVVLAVQPQLRELLSGLGPAIEIVARTAPPERYDFHCALSSLPLAFRTTLADIPARIPYLFADPLRVARWRQRLGDAGYRIGIVWQGSRNRIDIGRSLPLEMFARLATIAGVRLISLQKGAGREQLRQSNDLPVEDLGEEFDTGPQAFLDSAAVMSSLDLIITCDTALAHLAGALGRPTWIALKHVPEWRWLLDRADSPWYPTARLFRQSRRGDWAGVFAEIHDELVRRVRVSG
jgi:tetratricopeptide (TPR) repeat protein